MTKGHNKDKNDVQQKHKGGQEHLKNKAKRKATVSSGRNEDISQSGGTKGKNNI